MAGGKKVPQSVNWRLGPTSHRYRETLQKALCMVQRIAVLLGVSWSSLSSEDLAHVDLFMADVVQYMFDHKFPHYIAVYSVLAVQKHFRARNHLIESWSCIKTWKLHTPHRKRLPISFNIVQGMCLCLLNRAGYLTGQDRCNCISLVVFLVVGFFGLLRPGEIFRLRFDDIGLPTDMAIAGEKVAVIMIKEPKNRLTYGRNQFVHLEDPLAIVWISWWKSLFSPGEFLFPSRKVLTILFKDVLAELSLDSVGYTFGGLRAGGATSHFRVRRDIVSLQYLGRWQSLRTISHYLQEAMSAQLRVTMPPASVTKLESWLRFSHLLKTPPTASLSRRPARYGKRRA